MEKSLSLTKEILFVLHQLKKAGFEGFLVGGAVRDLLLGKNPYSFDFDFTTNATPEQIAQLFPESFYENQFGTVSLTAQALWQQMAVDQQYQENIVAALKKLQSPTNNKIIDLAHAKKVHLSLNPKAAVETESIEPTLPNFEITTYRSDELYTQGSRKPLSLNWGSSLDEDLKRRDFTINAIAFTLPIAKIETLLAELNQQAKLIIQVSLDELELTADPDALKDLNAGLIKSVGDPLVRFKEDALRMLRAVRLAVQLDMTIDPNIIEAIKTSRQLLSEVSFERIRDEFLKMLKSNQPKQAIQLLDQTQLLAQIIPELETAKGVEQGGHHTTDVWLHSLDALAACPNPDSIVRLATLLHDIGKPITCKLINGQPTFYNHEIIGAHMAKKIGRRLKLSKNQIDKLFILVRYHMFHYQPQNTDASIRRFMRRVGLEFVDDILDLREGDRLGSGARKTSWRLEEMKQRLIEQLNQPLDVTDLAINGHDLMESLGLKPGPVLGQILSELLEKVLENPELNQKTTLLNLAREFVSQANFSSTGSTPTVAVQP